MARYRVNPNAIYSSKNYKQSKKLHMVIKEEIVIKRQAYIKVFGNLIAITLSEVVRFEKEMTIIWK